MRKENWGKVSNPMRGVIMDLVNQRFGSLLVTEFSHQDGWNTRFWKCTCSCGRVTTVTTSNLRSGKIVSCGCMRGHRGRPKGSGRHTGHEDISGRKWWEIQAAAIQRSIEFNITKEQVWDKYLSQSLRCALTDLPISFLDGSASVDRIDSSGIYELSNIQIVHRNINLMKNAFSQEHFVEMCRKVAEKFGQ